MTSSLEIFNVQTRIGSGFTKKKLLLDAVYVYFALTYKLLTKNLLSFSNVSSHKLMD